MKNFRFFLILFAVSIIYLDSFSFQLSVSEDLSRFDNKPVVALWRGVNFSTTHFPTEQDRFDYIDNHGLLKPIYCGAAHTAANVSYTEIVSDHVVTDLNRHVEQIIAAFKRFNNSAAITINRQQFPNHRHAFQQIYTNSTTFISRIGGQDSERKYAPLLAGLPTGNPLLSFSYSIKHAGFYGYGMKDYGSLKALVPSYNADGTPEHKLVGHIVGILLTDAEAKQVMPYDVQLNHRAGNVKVKTFSSCNILAEQEVSLVGTVPSHSAVVSIDLKVPDLSDESDAKKFGLRKVKINNAKKIFANPNVSQDGKIKKTKAIIGDILKGTETDDLAHQNTLTYKAENLIEEAFKQQGLTYLAGKITVNGTIVNRN